MIGHTPESDTRGPSYDRSKLLQWRFEEDSTETNINSVEFGPARRIRPSSMSKSVELVLYVAATFVRHLDSTESGGNSVEFVIYNSIQPS